MFVSCMKIKTKVDFTKSFTIVVVVANVVVVVRVVVVVVVFVYAG